MSLHLSPTFRQVLAESERALVGLWAVSGSPLAAEILAGSGADWLLIDMEHSANNLDTVSAQLQAVAAYPVTPLVRVPFGDDVVLKQVLDIGAQNVIVPMVSSAEQARHLVEAIRYPPQGRRGVGSSLARSARWNRVDDYLIDANEHVSLIVQVESAEAVDAAAEIAAVDGVDGVFIGPADLAASLGVLGQQTHPDVRAAVQRTFDAVHSVGKPVGVNAFDPAAAAAYVAAGADFIAVAADVSLLARGSEAIVARFAAAEPETDRDAY
ncbi:HpcH/HpaI aldolase family protein [Microbacterium gorillae]|uniref:HpcH/HpaI aldolase family protein n=1 Tax=Microbacterium gorillae TaxID=1231063 RepID=UPI00058BE666|nr:HpcH/HpaI aldolase/citrate lyase family protein [Microbacterium gorillae]